MKINTTALLDEFVKRRWNLSNFKIMDLVIGDHRTISTPYTYTPQNYI
jgi:hypothetical protein